MEQLKKRVLSVLSLAFVAALTAGVAGANVTAKAETMNDFAITATSVRFDDVTRDGIDSGLRFKVDMPVAKESVTEAYTVVSLTTAAGESWNTSVPADVWRKDGSGWNTVVMDIPDTDYATVITAQAFAVVDGVTYETQAVTSSIAKTASLVMNAGLATDSQVGMYVAGKVQSIVLDKANAELKDGETLQLSATVTPADYAVVWASDNTAVATVDKTGKVTAVGAGTANITASMGGVTSEACVVTSSYKTVYDFEDGKNTALFTPSYGTDKVTSIVDYKGSKALKMTAPENAGDLAFEVAGDYMHWAFAQDGVECITFDFTMVFEISGSTYTQTKLNYDGRAFGWSGEANTFFFDSGVTQTLTITKAQYETWAALSYNTFRMVVTNRTWAVTWYIDNWALHAYQTSYDFEDGYLPAFFTKYSNFTLGMADFDGGKALKVSSTTSQNSYALQISAEYMNWAFAHNNVESLSFDVTANFVQTSEKNTIVIYYDMRAFGTATYKLFENGVASTFTITKAQYETWKAANLTTFRLALNSRNYAMEMYIDNFTVNIGLGEAPEWIYWHASYSTNTTKSLVMYNGAVAVKMSSDAKNSSEAIVFEISKAHLDEIFADASVTSYSFDITYVSDKAQLGSMTLFNYADNKMPTLTQGVTHNYAITRADYTKMTDGTMGATTYNFRLAWNISGYATTFYLANFTVNK